MWYPSSVPSCLVADRSPAPAAETNQIKSRALTDEPISSFLSCVCLTDNPNPCTHYRRYVFTTLDYDRSHCTCCALRLASVVPTVSLVLAVMLQTASGEG